MINTLIFDFGDVFLNLDKTATAKRLKSLGLDNFNGGMIEMNQAYEVGAVSSEEFLKFYKKEVSKASESQLVNAWNAILQDFPKHQLEFLQQLKQDGNFQLILLSNTNAFHMKWVKEHIPFYEAFKNCFDQFYLSYEIGLRKPNAHIFKFVINENNLDPETCFFVDDTKENTETASKLGIKTWNINPKTEDVTELFEKHIVE